MTLTVNGQPAEPGCYVDGHWGQYGPDHFAGQLEGFGIVIPKGIDPMRYRRIREWIEERCSYPYWEGPLANVYLACSESDDEVENLANSLTEGGYWEWYDGECFLRSYVCSECGRDARVDGHQVAELIQNGFTREHAASAVRESHEQDGAYEATLLVGPDDPCDFCCDADDPGVFA